MRVGYSDTDTRRESDNSSLFRVVRNARFICLSTAPSLLTDPAGKIKANLLNTYACAGLCSRASFASVFLQVVARELLMAYEPD